MPRKPKVLYVAHNHPSLFPGGAEIYALELYKAMRAAGEFDPILLARAAMTASSERRARFESPFTVVGDDPNQYLLHTDVKNFDFLFNTHPDKLVYTRYFHEFLEAHRPDIVHFQHTLFLGFDLLQQTRTTLPDAKIVYTLHEYLPICHNVGQMVRKTDNSLCRESSPSQCNRCFPEISPQTFFLRKRFTQAHFELVDMFLAPSHFLLERYVDWGIPREKIRFEEYGRSPVRPRPELATDRPRNRVAFFGQLTPFKGVDVLLQAMQLVGAEGVDAHLFVHGANLEFQTPQFRQQFNSLLETNKSNTTLVGPYTHSDLADLMANVDWVVVPSIWWENSPLVIQEAFAHGRPVICSDIGGMAEKVHDGVNGLHFRRGDPHSLARVIRSAVETPGLWDRLRAGIEPIYRMDRSVAVISDLYRRLQAESPLLEGSARASVG